MRYRTLSARIAGLLLLAPLAAMPSLHSDPAIVPPGITRADLQAQALRCRQILKTSIVDFYIAWDMHPRAGPRLILDWKYTPTPGFGVLVKDALTGNSPAKEQPPIPPAPPRQ